jgi:hypothetical protein
MPGLIYPGTPKFDMEGQCQGEPYICTDLHISGLHIPALSSRSQFFFFLPNLLVYIQGAGKFGTWKDCLLIGAYLALFLLFFFIVFLVKFRFARGSA